MVSTYSIEVEGKCRQLVFRELMVAKETPSDSEIQCGEVICCEASSLSMADKFMTYRVQSMEEFILWRALEDVIEKGINNFWIKRSKFIEFDMHLFYYDADTMKTYMEERMKIIKEHYRTATLDEHIALSGIFIKTLVDDGNLSVDKAWKVVCSSVWSEYTGFSYKDGLKSEDTVISMISGILTQGSIQWLSLE